MRISFRTMFIGLLAALACATLMYCSRDGVQELRIGIAMPLSGSLADSGRSMLQAAQLAAEEIGGSGTEAGRKIRVRIFSVDDKGGDELAPKAAQALMAQKVAAVVGHLTSGASIAAAPVYACTMPSTFLPRLRQRNRVLIRKC